MKLDTAIVLAAIALAMLWPIHQQLTIRALRRAIHQLHQRQRQHAGAIIQLQTTVAETPLQVHQPMPRVGRRVECKPEADRFHPAPANESPLDADDTLRLARPPAMGDIEATLAKASRPLTRMEIARRTGMEPWEVGRQLRDMWVAKRVEIVATHDSDSAYVLASETTTPMPNGMPILWGAR